jgi:hypothetical protein
MSKSLSEVEVAQMLQSIEHEAGLFKLFVRGYSPWRLMRFPVGVAIQGLPFNAPALPKKIIFKACLRSLRDLIFLPQADYVVKSFSSALRVGTPAGYEDLYFEDILRKIPNGIRLHSINAVGFTSHEPAWKGGHIDVTALLVLGSVLARIFPVRGRGSYETIYSAIAPHVPKGQLSKRRIQRIFSSFWWQSILYQWLLHRIGATSVVVADTGERALLKAARNMGCQFVELQHGIFTPNHPDALPVNEGLSPSQAGLLVPDIVAVYGKYWVDIHKHTLLGQFGRIKAVGSSFIERLRASHGVGEKNKSLRILVTTQGVARLELIAFLQEFLSKSSSLFILDIKLHPAYDQSTAVYMQAFGEDRRVNIIPGSSSPDTYQLLMKSDLHISISSACHYDAVGLYVPTIILALPGHEIALGLVENSEALLVKSGGELADLVDSRSWIQVTNIMAEKYYRPKFTENLLELLTIK